MGGHRQKWLFVAVTLVFVLALLELLAFFGGRFLETKGVFYRPQAIDGYAQYLDSRDPVLGWPSPLGPPAAKGAGPKGRDASGSRIIPAFPDPDKHPSLISLYGNSFTFSDEVSAENAWSNALSKMLGRRVANYGVGGYGSDQALLRYRENRDDTAEVILLNHFSENILRNVNQYRALLYPSVEGLGWKPRFILGAQGELILVPLPTYSPEEIAAVVANPGDYLANETFVPGDSSGFRELSFPFTLSLLASLSHFQMRARLAGLPFYSEFYDPEHPSQAVPVTVGIFREFEAEARRRGQVPVSTVIPSGMSLVSYRDTGNWSYQPLLDQLKARNIDVLDFGPEIIERVGPEGIEALFGDIGGHFNESGYRLLAEITRDHLLERGVLEEPPQD